MIAIASMERVYDSVKLVRGKGSRRRGRMCIMSFVALLAGERHTDAPETASSFIRHFAIHFNDAVPTDERQRLKPFAPRIMGTNDGFDPERVSLVLRILEEEVVPKFYAELAASRYLVRVKDGQRSSDLDTTKSPQDFVSAFIANAALGLANRESDRVAVAAARLLSFCGALTPDNAGPDWYWSKGIDLLDRLCDVGHENRRTCLNSVQVAHVQNILVRRNFLEMMIKVVSEIALSLRQATGSQSVASGHDANGAECDTAALAEPAPASLDPQNSSMPKRRTRVAC